jgi:hypothetical protein
MDLPSAWDKIGDAHVKLLLQLRAKRFLETFKKHSFGERESVRPQPKDIRISQGLLAYIFFEALD